ncbi:hypothetical protein ANCCAN_01227 [Ancylostoma caninum]|uniref:Uncharacterized protein n=1 Tax=Ancylostoma caninum TaxID=29170 RepID=A0A368HA80_ANCCA|nr:hypothetical protein ANCCAN_01227 [Ancylostoma caninum]
MKGAAIASENEPDIFALFSRRALYDALTADQSKSASANLVSTSRPKPPPAKPSGIGAKHSEPSAALANDSELNLLQARLAEVLQDIAEKQGMLMKNVLT